MRSRLTTKEKIDLTLKESEELYEFLKKGFDKWSQEKGIYNPRMAVDILTIACFELMTDYAIITFDEEEQKIWADSLEGFMKARLSHKEFDEVKKKIISEKEGEK